MSTTSGLGGCECLEGDDGGLYAEEVAVKSRKEERDIGVGYPFLTIRLSK